jgi:hypothetical protein
MQPALPQMRFFMERISIAARMLSNLWCKRLSLGKITEKQIDVSVKRLFMIRFRLGMFDPASMVKYANAPMQTLESAGTQSAFT